MTHTRLWVTASIIALVILIGFIISVPHTRDLPGSKPVVDTTATLPEVSLRDTYRKGTHTLIGTVVAPSPCTTLTASATLTGTTSSQSILVSIAMPRDTGVCLERSVSLPFSTTVAGPSGIPITVQVNGATVAAKDL